MTDIATALADTSKLPPYGDKPVIRTDIKVTNAGDGLSAGLAIEPEVLDLGRTVYVVLECVVDSHEHDRLIAQGMDTGQLVLHQVLKAGTGTMIDGEVVRQAIAEQAERIQRAKDKAAGRERLPYDEELARAHGLGEHAAGLVEGCAECAAEATAEANEALAEPTPIKGRRAKKGL